MILKKVGDIFKEKGNIGITTNNIVKPNGDLVMGAGIARRARNLHPSIARMFGNKVQKRHIAQPICSYKGQTLWSIPTKYHFKDKSNINLIEESLQQIKYYLDNNKINNINLPLLGCSNGGLSWKKDVEPLVVKYFNNDLRVTFWALEKKDFLS